LPKSAVDAYRRQALALFNKLKWVPSTASDRIWQSKAKRGMLAFPKDLNGPAPIIALNPSLSGAAIAWQDEE
jgi:hypothetical protein